MFPIKYIDNNLVWNKDNEVFAYYELIPYNYSFLSAEQKFIVHDSFRQLIAQSREGKIHALQIAKQTLEFFGIDKDDENNQKRLRDLENGQCLLQDLYGRVGVVQIHPVFEELLHAFDTRPPVKSEVE